jgi:hypothetical protein
MLKMIALVCFMLVVGPVNAQYEPMRKIDVKISPWQTRDALIYTPAPTVAGERFPLLIAFHGRSVAGKDLSIIYKEGVPRQLKEGKVIEAVNKVDGKLYKFIVLAPMAQSWSFAPQDVGPMLDDIIKRYPVDTTRIYLTGYSAGGWSVEAAKTHSAELANRIAACITMSPANLDPDYLKRFKLVADADIHTWYFVGSKDDYFRENVKRFMDSTAKYKKGLLKITVYPGAHCCWHSFLTPKYRENDMNVYEWLLQYKKTYAVKPRKR